MSESRFHPVDPQIITKTIAAAIAAGTHSRETTIFCTGCRRVVAGGAWWIEGRKLFCGACADKFDKGPESIRRMRERGAIINGPGKMVEVYGYAVTHPEVT